MQCCSFHYQSPFWALPSSHVLIATLTPISPFLSSSAAISGSAIRVLPRLKRTNWPQGSRADVARIPSLKGREKVAAGWEIECLQLRFSLSRSLARSGSPVLLSVDSPNKMASEQAGNKAFRQPTDRGRNTQGQCPKECGYLLREKYTKS